MGDVSVISFSRQEPTVKRQKTESGNSPT